LPLHCDSRLIRESRFSPSFYNSSVKYLYPAVTLLISILFSLKPSPAFGSPTFGAEPPPKKVTAQLWQTAQAAGVVNVIITAPGYPDLSPADRLSSKADKTRFVVQALLNFADRSQSQLRQDLMAEGKDYYPLWVTNQIALKRATLADLQALAARSDVAQIELDVQAKGVQDVPFGAQIANGVSTVGVRDVNAVEWGVARVRAPQVWAQGFTGQGIVIADLDTGVRWDHDALKPHYRGWNTATLTATHDFNWFDPVAFSPTPLDDHGHGTHTTGTLVGDDGAGNQVGVAPGAHWIACRNMNVGVGSVALYTACFQFALAPGDVNGNNPNPALAADITSNSWGCTLNEEGCILPLALVTVTQALRHAGIMVIASAGNSGAGGCSTVNAAPGALNQSFSIGATDISDAIASFSSRGPSTFTGRLKPDVVGPGVNVRSTYRTTTTSYSFLSGTSMAAPHVAGVVALLWSAAPWLRGQVAETEDILRASAQPISTVQTCGGVPANATPNNTFGYGMVNAEAAVQYARAHQFRYRMPIVSR